MFKNLIKIQCGISLLLIILSSFQVSSYASADFFHTHASSCMVTKSVTCDYTHTKSIIPYEEIKDCSTCQRTTDQTSYTTWVQCYKTDYFQMIGARSYCKGCQQYISSWGSDNIDTHKHTRKDTYADCGIEENKSIARVSVASSNTSPTNQSVQISASTAISNSSAITNSFTYSWDGASGQTKTVSENGVYTVTVRHSNGQSATASIEVSNIDKVAPVIKSITHDADSITSSSVIINISGSDDKSAVVYSVNGGASWQESGQFMISDGTNYSVGVKDSAGNTAFTTIKRSDFPYPYVPPVVTKEPESSPSGSGSTTTTPSTSNPTTNNNTTTTPQNTSEINQNQTPATSTPNDDTSNNQSSNTAGSGAGTSQGQLENGETSSQLEYELTPEQLAAILEREERERLLCIYPDKEGNYNTSGILVPMTYVDVLEQQEQKEQETLIETSDSTDSLLENDLFKKDITLLNTKTSILGIIFIGCILVSLYFILFGPNTGALYGLDDAQNPISFYKIRKISIRKKEGKLYIQIPENINHNSHNQRFRIFLKKYYVEKNNKQQVKICVGNRRLVADLEECIDFTL